MYLQSLYTCREKKKRLWLHELVPTLQSKCIFLAFAYSRLYFNLVFIYTDNKAKPKEGKRRNGLRHNFSFYQQNEMVVDNKGGMSEMDTHQRGSQSVTFINEERDVLKWNTLSQVEFSIGV